MPPKVLTARSFNDTARKLINTARGAVFEHDGRQTFVKPEDGQFCVVSVPVTEEDQKAALAALWNSKASVAGDPMTLADMALFILEPAISRVLHRNRSRVRWGDNQVYAALPENDEGHITPITDPIEGSWDCPTSPTKLCWYDEWRDPASDHCLFCGDPHERK